MQSGGFWKRSRSIFKRICALPLIALVKFYQLCISPFTPPSCRFTPTCSQYALEALRKHGLLKGSWLTLRRLSRGAAADTIRCPEMVRRPKMLRQPEADRYSEMVRHPEMALHSEA